MAGITAHATKPDLKVFAEVFEHSHVAGCRRGEFHGEMVHLQPVELAKDGSVTSGVSGFAPGAGAGATAEVNGYLDIAEPFDNLVDHIDTKVSGAVGVVVVCSNFRVNKQAKVRVVNLNDSDAFFAQELDFAAQDGNAVGDE